jgi:hypothetical protein
MGEAQDALQLLFKRSDGQFASLAIPLRGLGISFHSVAVTDKRRG